MACMANSYLFVFENICFVYILTEISQLILINILLTVFFKNIYFFVCM